jgi:Lipoprotein LpqB beta-propeller domain/Sporulation and spore germination
VARLVRKRIRLPMTLTLAALTAAVAGCATAPSGGPPRPAPGGNNQVQAYVQPLPPPGPTNSPIWTPRTVVLGFLHASASYAFDSAAARQYLVPELRRSWHPGRGVTVVGGTPAVTPVPYNPKESLGSGQSAQVVVQFTGQQLATVSQSGQYRYAPGNVNMRFLLAKNTNGVWQIEQLPPLQTLMLTESDFEEVYQPRNLFFFAPAPDNETPNVLVPDPVYAPLQSSNSALNTDLATGLVNGLLKGQGGWLSGATISAFPAGTRLLKKVTITGKTAQVDLGGAAARAQPQQVGLMADQLAATLADGSYALPLASHVELSIDNAVQYNSVSAADLVPTVSSGPVELITGASSGVGELPPPVRGAKLQPRLGQDQIGPVTVTAVASSPSSDHPQLAVAIRNAGGCAVEEQPGGQGAYKTYALAGSAGACTSLSYDANGNLWATAGSGVWVLSPGHSPVAVDTSAMATAIQPGDRIIALQMAPDAVRAALLVSAPAGNRLLLAAAHFQGGSVMFGQPVTVGAGLTDDPVAISWYNAYNLAVLGTDGIYEVPLTTGAGQQPPALITALPTGVQTLTMTTDGTELVVGTSQGVQAEAVSSPNNWSFIANGADPVYPG